MNVLRRSVWGLVVPLAIIGLSACGGGSKEPRPPAPTASVTTATSVVAQGETRAVSNGGLTIDVPESWGLFSPESCATAHGPALIVGSFSALQGCPFAFHSAGVIVAFGSGGPPLPPIPANHEKDETINGISAQVFTDSDTALSLDQSELLAVFPGRNAWLHAVAPGTELGTSLAPVSQALATIHATPGSTAVPTGSIDETFIGNWYVHDGQLTIASTTSGALIDSHGCADNCVESDFLSLTLSANGARMRAVVKKVTYTNPSTGQAVRDTDHNPADTGHVGDSFSLEFIEPHLLLSTDNVFGRASTDLGSGNYYWCGTGLALQFSPACGA